MTEASSLYPVNQIGSDGFNWWIGQIESVKADDAKGGDRWKVRIVGLHPRDCNTVKSEDLPWARVVMPVHAPHITGAATSVSTQLEPGAWVVGFFMDNDKQQPIIIGSIGRDPNSDGEDVSDDPSPSESGCKSFTTFLNPENKIVYDQLVKDNNKPSVTDTGHLGDGTDREESVGVDEGVKAIHSKNTPANPGGIQFCVEVADKCGKETDMNKTFTRLFGEMLRDIQDNDGQLGDYVVGQLSGKLNDAMDIGRKYVNKAIRLIRSFVAKIKGFVLEQIKKAVKYITKAILRPAVDGLSLTPVTEFFNKALKELGCKMADLSDRLAKFLEDIIFGYLFNLYKQTACQVDKFVNGVVGKIQSLMTDLLRNILGPLQDILGAIAAPLNMIGNAINFVLKLLGISCEGPPSDCAKTPAVCTTGQTDEREDFLDNLLNSLEDGALGDIEADWTQYTCDDTSEGKKIDGTDVVFIGGIQENPGGNIIRYSIEDIVVQEGQIATFEITRWGKIDVASSVTFSTRNGTAKKVKDYEEASGIIGFAPGISSRTLDVRTFLDYDSEGDEDFFVRIFPDSPGTVRQMARKNIARCTIQELDVRDGTAGYNIPIGEIPQSDIPFETSFNPTNQDFYEDPDEPEDIDDTTKPDTTDVAPTEVSPTYAVTADKVIVKEGDFITYTITTTNIGTGTVLEYSLFGSGITPEDFVDNKMSGAFVIEENTARVIVGIAEDSTFESEEALFFSVVGTGASVSVLIESDTAGFSDEEITQAEDGSSNEPTIRTPSVPIVGEIVTGPGGEILDIPIHTTGDPYTELPFVLISGNGFSAGAVPLSDENGYITEIRVTDPGFGYRLNTPANSGKECIIDSFTLITPGREYTSTPTVYVNGDSTIAEAVINDRGQVVSVRIKNREITFASYPKVQLIGGGGYGASFLPSLACLDPEARVKVGSAKIGTGSYVDCP